MVGLLVGAGPYMRVIDRYISREVIGATLFAVVVLTFVLVLGNILQRLMEEILRSQLPLGTVLMVIAYILPFSLVFTIPWGMLTSILLVFGRLSADNELVSLRMAGLSMWRICLPVFAFALGLSALCSWLNLVVAPRAEAGIKRVFAQSVLDNPMALFTADQVSDAISGVRVYAAEKEGNELRGFQMVQYDSKRAAVFATADRVVVNRTAAGDALELHMFDARFQISSDPGTPGAEPDPTAKASPIFSESFQEISLEKNLEKATKRSPSARGSLELLAMARDPGYGEGERCSFRVELHKRLSFSMACVTFALVGVPLGVTAQRRETSVGFALSLIIAVVYFLFIIIADWFKESPDAYPQLLVWLPNIVFIGVGLWRFGKLARA